MMLLLRAGIETNPGPQQNDIEDWELEEFSDSTKEYKTDRKLCAVCGVGNVTAVLRKTEQSEMLVYTRNGIIKGKHLEYRCNSRRNNECRAYHGYGFYKKDGGKVYENDALKKEILVVSPQSAFQIEYLIELAASIEINNDNFEGLAKVYNRLHNRRLPSDTATKRQDLNRKRMTEAYFLYIYLELAQRYKVKNYQVI